MYGYVLAPVTRLGFAGFRVRSHPSLLAATHTRRIIITATFHAVIGLTPVTGVPVSVVVAGVHYGSYIKP